MAREGKPTPEEVREQCRKMRGSEAFGKQKRLADLLDHIIERVLQGREHELREQVIGMDFFRKRPGWNPKKETSVVRVQMRNLRNLLKDYYAKEGLLDPVVIGFVGDRPYVPVFGYAQEQDDEGWARRTLELMQIVIRAKKEIAELRWARFFKRKT